MSLVFILLSLFVIVRSDADQNPDDSDFGSFWQLADIHYDVNYSSPLIAPNLCRVSEGFRNSSTGKGGMFGDYMCDSSWALTISAIEAMKNIAPSADFILWTGDSIPHVSDDFIDLEKVYTVIQNVTDKIKEVLPKVPIYPLLGNHDVWPANQLPFSNDSQYYADMLSKAGWSKLLEPDEQTVFKQGGYFSKPLRPGLRLICLNSNLWYAYDKLVQNVTDPAGQFHWLELEMQKARNLSEKVILSGHVPPGVVGRTTVASGAWMYPLFNKRLLWLLQRYSDIITSAIFGHEHVDGFHIVYDADGKPIVPVFLAPAVTPWNSTMPGMGSNNPGLRLYHYKRKTGRITDYTQFYLNLTEANALGKANWQVEYKAKTAYNLTDVSPTSLDKLVAWFKQDGSELFQRYYDYNSVSLNKSPCVDMCKRRHICSITKIDFDDHNKCLQTELSNSTSDGRKAEVTSVSYDESHHHTRPWHHHEVKGFTYYLLGAILVLIVILFFIIAFCCCQRRHAVVLLGRSKYVIIQEAEA